MTDTRKQLEAIAKVMGRGYNSRYYDKEDGILVWEPPVNYESHAFNPLTDNGDCAVMCAELGIDTHWSIGGKVLCFDKDVYKLEEAVSANHNNDKLAAWRFAACAVAARIGEMK